MSSAPLPLACAVSALDELDKETLRIRANVCGLPSPSPSRTPPPPGLQDESMSAVSRTLMEAVCRRISDSMSDGNSNIRCLVGRAFAITESWQDVLTTKCVLSAFRMTGTYPDDLCDRITALGRRVEETGGLCGVLRYIAAAMLCDSSPFVHLKHDDSNCSLTVVPFRHKELTCFLPVNVAHLNALEQGVFTERPDATGQLDPVAQFYNQRSAQRQSADNAADARHGREPSPATLTLLSEFTADLTRGEPAIGYRRAPKRRKLT